MTRLSRIFSIVAIALGLLLLVLMVSQIDIDVGRNMHKWATATEAVEQR